MPFWSIFLVYSSFLAIFSFSLNFVNSIQIYVDVNEIGSEKSNEIFM